MSTTDAIDAFYGAVMLDAEEGELTATLRLSQMAARMAATSATITASAVTDTAPARRRRLGV